MSKKSITISLPAKAPRANLGARAGSEEWVRDPGGHPGDSAPFADPMAFRLGPPFIVDLAAERSLVEVWALSAIVPFALGWFWLVHAMMGRLRF